MAVKCATIITAMENLSPGYLAEIWDNVGLLVGNPEQVINRILISLDVTDKTVEYAINEGCEMIISHHPLIFKNLTNISTVTSQGKIITKLIKNNIVVYSAHTNLDVCNLGINDVLAEKIGLSNISPLIQMSVEKVYKLVVFAPTTYADIICQAIFEVCAKKSENYNYHIYQTNGLRKLMPFTNTNSSISKKNCFEILKETRLEVIIKHNILEQVIQAILKVHFYKEVTYDVFELINQNNSSIGMGRVGFLQKPLTLNELSENIKKCLNLKFLKVAGKLSTKISKVAVCGGRGGDMVKKALEHGADVLVTGDVKYHEAQDAISAGMFVIDAGHFATEIIILNNLQKYLNDWAIKKKWDVIIYKNHTEVDVFTLI